MPICNRCGDEFNVEKKPRALMFGHPSTVKKAVLVWKAHICQKCETIIVKDFKKKPKVGVPAVESERLALTKYPKGEEKKTK